MPIGDIREKSNFLCQFVISDIMLAVNENITKIPRLTTAIRPSIVIMAISFLCRFAGSSLAFKSGHQQYYEMREISRNAVFLAFFICWVCM